MNSIGNHKLEIANDGIRLTIAVSNKSGCAIVFIGILGLTMFLMPIVTILILSIEITFGTLLVCLCAWLISGYLFRLYLWNKYGEEVFIITTHELEHYNDYKLYKDNRKTYSFTKLETVYREDESDSSLHTRLSQIGFSLDENLIVRSHDTLSVKDIIEIAAAIEKYIVDRSDNRHHNRMTNPPPTG